MTNEIMVIDNLSAIEVFGTVGNIDPILDKIDKEVKSYVLDISTPNGRKEIASLAHKVARSKTALDAMGKELNEAARKGIDVVDAERRRMRDHLDALKEEVRHPLTEYENKEKDRVKGHEDALIVITDACVFDGTATIEDVQDRINVAEKTHASRAWEEFAVPAKAAAEETLQRLNNSLAALEKQAAEQAELEKLRKDAEERETKEREDRIAQEAAENARLEAEAKAKAEREEAERKATEEREAAAKATKDAEERADAARKAQEAAEAKAAQDAEDAATKERERIEAEKAAEEAAATKREADKKHRAKINNQALAALTDIGVSEPAGKAIIEAIAKGNIPNVSISY